MPTELKLLHGERRPSRLNRNAPKSKNLPEMPAGMSEQAQAIWIQVVSDCAAIGTLTRLDSYILRGYCEAVLRYEQSAALLESSGPLVTGARRGELVRSPLHQVVRDNANLMLKFARELGFTPSARTTLTAVQESDDQSALARWMRGEF